MQLTSGHLYEFGPFVLDTTRHLLLLQGKPVPLTPKTYDLLVVLVENSGRVILKDELMKMVWVDSFVEDSNLTQQISSVRKALGETAGEDRYIVTVPGKGYRFAAAVNEPVVKDRTQPAGRRMGTVATVGGVATIAILIGVGYSILRRPAQESPRSLAILPFQSLKGDPESDFLGFSLADEVITKLGAVRSLTVRPSSAVEKYRKEPVDFRQAAAELQVDTLLTGNFLRDGEDLRITSQLIDVKTQNILWKGAFDLKYDKLLTVQDSVAQQIVKGLQLSLSPREMESLRPEKPVDPLAYEYYLRGVDLYAQNEFPMAIKMLRKSAGIDASYSPTWAHLGRSLTANASFELGGREEYREAQAAYEKALSLKAAPIEASIYMANLFTDTGQVERAVPLLREALKTNPNHAEVHWELGYAYRFAGMLNASAVECERARHLDPGVKLGSSALNAYLYLGQYDRFLQSLPKDNGSALILFYRGFGEYHKKNLEEAAKSFDAAFELRPTLLQARIGKALSEGIRGHGGRGLELLRDTESKVATRGAGDPEAMYKIAEAYAMLGDRPSALRALRTSIEGGFFSYPYLVTDPLLESLRREDDLQQQLAAARQRHEAFKRRFF
jgi:DNA-binding winged helix-turn-helix (wHTH) protein/TolB-like protein/tetratricopeptide (TPR) repeat protein